MTTQPEALRLADVLERVAPRDERAKAAAELRRLHAEVARLQAYAAEVAWKYSREKRRAQP
jgi:hypothetical protein